uniref:Uncharacterized protein n=1 Tax=Oryza meridionalis TaxID=40149 RepID=A0A0E0D3N2_9ORYZ
MYTANSNENKFQFRNARSASKLRNFTLEMHAVPVFDGIPQCRVEGGGCRRGRRRGGPRRGGAPAHLRAPRRRISWGKNFTKSDGIGIVLVIEKDPNKAVPLFWAAINSGDRIENALKDMATVLKQANRAVEAIEAIRSFRDRCPNEA